jgi:aspartyl-tRNA(Asn)/glutamyl-tRNA(Gln) amidotransferase subunit C
MQNSPSNQPSVQVDQDLIRKVAKLARIQVTEEEVESYAGHLTKILGYVAQIQEVSTEGVEPRVQPFDFVLGFSEESKPHVREDQPELFGESGDILKSAPQVIHHGYQVPPIL